VTVDELKHSPLDAVHRRLGAKMGPFAGWEMPPPPKPKPPAGPRPPTPVPSRPWPAMPQRVVGVAGRPRPVLSGWVEWSYRLLEYRFDRTDLTALPSDPRPCSSPPYSSFSPAGHHQAFVKQAVKHQSLRPGGGRGDARTPCWCLYEP
jgi:hypothetical protein